MESPSASRAPRPGPRWAGPARIPADLAPDERAVAGWFAAASRVGAGPELRARVLAAARAAPPSPPQAEPETVQRLWGWWTAAAAVLLLAVGLAALAETPAAPSGTGPGSGTAARAPETAGPAVPGNLRVMDDPNLALFHDLETFDGLGVRPGDVLALGDR